MLLGHKSFNLTSAYNFVPGATQVSATFLMAAEPLSKMAEMHESADLKWDGSRYTGAVKFPMTGKWQFTVQATRNGQNLVVYHGSVDVK